MKGFRFSSGFGPRLKISEKDRYDFHLGMDLVPLYDDKVYAVYNGTVYAVYLEGDPKNPYPNGGNVVVLKHTLPTPFSLYGKNWTAVYSVYMHLSELSLSPRDVGKKVVKGDVIGKSGSSGTTLLNHLHFETRVATTCSAPYQQRHPQKRCSAIFGAFRNPHVNPLYFLDYLDTNSYALNISSCGSDACFSVSGSKREWDFDCFTAFMCNGEQKRVCYKGFEGIDQLNVDNNDLGWVVIEPYRIAKQSNKWAVRWRVKSPLSAIRAVAVSDINGFSLNETLSSC